MTTPHRERLEETAYAKWNEVGGGSSLGDWPPYRGGYLDGHAAGLAEGEAKYRRLADELRGDGPCDDCGTIENIVWFTANAFWNDICRPEGYDRDPILCIPCFVTRASARYRIVSWELTPCWHPEGRSRLVEALGDHHEEEQG